MFDAWIDKYKTVGNPTERVAGYRYAPFGAVAQAVGACAATNPFRFSSEYADDELGLVYYNCRHYNPLDGRWVNRDPIEEQGGFNLYGFVINRPVLMSDRMGEIIIPATTFLIASLVEIAAGYICKDMAEEGGSNGTDAYQHCMQSCVFFSLHGGCERPSYWRNTFILGRCFS